MLEALEQCIAACCSSLSCWAFFVALHLQQQQFRLGRKQAWTAERVLYPRHTEASALAVKVIRRAVQTVRGCEDAEDDIKQRLADLLAAESTLRDGIDGMMKH